MFGCPFRAVVRDSPHSPRVERLLFLHTDSCLALPRGRPGRIPRHVPGKSGTGGPGGGAAGRGEGTESQSNSFCGPLGMDRRTMLAPGEGPGGGDERRYDANQYS